MAALLRTLAGSGRNAQGTAGPVHSYPMRNASSAEAGPRLFGPRPALLERESLCAVQRHHPVPPRAPSEGLAAPSRALPSPGADRGLRKWRRTGGPGGRHRRHGCGEGITRLRRRHRVGSGTRRACCRPRGPCAAPSRGRIVQAERAWLYVVVDDKLFRSQVFENERAAVEAYRLHGLDLGVASSP